MAELLGENDIASRLEDSEWHREGDEIFREWRLENFAQAMEFVVGSLDTLVVDPDSAPSEYSREIWSKPESEWLAWTSAADQLRDEGGDVGDEVEIEMSGQKKRQRVEKISTWKTAEAPAPAA